MFIEEKIQELGLLSAIPNQFTITNYSDRIITIEGKIELLSITPKLIAIIASGKPINIEGDNLLLKNLTKSSINIAGNIKNIK